MSLVPLSLAGPTPLALRSCVPPVVANERLFFILPILYGISCSLFSLSPGPDLDELKNCRGSKVSSSLIFHFLVVFFFIVDTVLEGVVK